MPSGEAEERPHYQSDERWEVRCLVVPASDTTKMMVLHKRLLQA